MNPSSPVLACPAAPSLCCQVAAYAAIAMTADAFPTLRRNPGPPVGAPISPALLKHADQQTVAGLAAVLQAIHEHELRGVSFREWGAIAGPSLLGRQASADSIRRFRAEGAFAISPHLIPHESLHAVSGTVSQVLDLHGPNLGVGGGPGAADDALLVAATMLAGAALPGLWVVLTDFDPEMIPDEDGTGAPPILSAPAPWVCHAVALALVPSGNAAAPDLSLAVTASGTTTADDAPLRLAELADALPPRPGSARGWRLRGGARLVLSSLGTGTESLM